MIRTLLSLCLALSPLAVAASDGVLAAYDAVKLLWPDAAITALSDSAPCAGTLSTDTPSAARNGLVQVRVRCEITATTTGWTRYIALRAEQPTAIAVLRTPLAQGAPLTADLIDWQTRDALRVPVDVLKSSTTFKALIARRSLPAGSVLSASQFKAPPAIQRGQSVTLLSRASGMEVRAPGEALADAVLGNRVQVRNKNSRRIVEGIARADAIVEIAL